MYRFSSPVTWFLILANALVFFAETVSGGSRNTAVAKKFGALYVPDLKRGRWYELITSMFVHFGVIHIACNMYSLYNIGVSLEYFLGSGRYLALYLISGICGNLLTAYVQTRKGRFTLSAGASGAVFGLIGVYVMLAILPAYRRYVDVGGIIITLVINVLYGAYNRQINTVAHIGGLIGGMLMTLIYVLI